MPNAELYINDNRMDLPDNFALTARYAANSLDKFDTLNGVGSGDIKLPKTNGNRERFNNADKFNSTDTTPYTAMTARYEKDGERHLIGNAHLKSASERDFRMYITSGNSNFFNAIRDKKLSDLVLTSLDHLWNDTNVIANRFNTWASGFIYPDINYGLWDTDTSKTRGGEEFYPAVYVKYILQQIAAEAGYNIVSDWHDNHILYSKMIFPFARKEYLQSESWINLKKFRADLETPHTLAFGPFAGTWVGFDNDSTGGFFDNDGQYTTGSWSLLSPQAIFLPNETMDCDFVFKVNYTVTFWGASAYMIIRWNNGAGMYEHPGGTGTFEVEIEKTNINLSTSQYPLIEGQFFTTTFNSGELYNKPFGNTYFGATSNIGSTLPDMKQTDFVRMLMAQFGLIIQTVGSDVKIEQFNKLRENKPNALDWSELADLTSQEPPIRFNFANYAQTNFLEYSGDDDDELLSAREDYGRGQIPISNVNLTPETTIYQSDVAPILRNDAFTGAANPAAVAQIPLFGDTGEKDFSPVSRIAWVEVTHNATNDIILVSTQGAQTVTPAVFFTGLGFDELLASDNDLFVATLESFKQIGPLLRLRDGHIRALDFFKPVWFEINGEGAYFYISEIPEYDFSKEESTRVNLVKLPI